MPTCLHSNLSRQPLRWGLYQGLVTKPSQTPLSFYCHCRDIASDRGDYNWMSFGRGRLCSTNLTEFAKKCSVALKIKNPCEVARNLRLMACVFLNMEE